MWTCRRPDLAMSQLCSTHHAHLVFQIDTLPGADLVSEEDSVLMPLPLHHVYPSVMGMPPERV